MGNAGRKTRDSAVLLRLPNETAELLDRLIASMGAIVGRNRAAIIHALAISHPSGAAALGCLARSLTTGHAGDLQGLSDQALERVRAAHAVESAEVARASQPAVVRARRAHDLLKHAGSASVFVCVLSALSCLSSCAAGVGEFVRPSRKSVDTRSSCAALLRVCMRIEPRPFSMRWPVGGLRHRRGDLTRGRWRPWRACTSTRPSGSGNSKPRTAICAPRWSTSGGCVPPRWTRPSGAVGSRPKRLDNIGRCRGCSDEVAGSFVGAGTASV